MTALCTVGAALLMMIKAGSGYSMNDAVHSSISVRVSTMESQVAALESLQLEHCKRLFIDGGANTGEALEAFVSGTFHACAMSAPYRVYPTSWASLGRRARLAIMAPLREPRSFCMRSFEAAPELIAPLRARGRVSICILVTVRLSSPFLHPPHCLTVQHIHRNHSIR